MTFSEKLNLNRKNLFGNAVVSSATLIKVLTLRSFKEHNFLITPEQFVILDTLIENNKIYQRQLGALIGKDRPNVARLLGILEKKGLIEKITDSNGRQINRLVVTDRGKKLRDEILPVVTKVRNSYLSEFEESELLQCFNTLNKIKEVIARNTKLKL